MFENLFKFWDRTSFYLSRPVYYAGFAAVGLFMLSFLVPFLFVGGQLLLLLTVVAVIVDSIFLYSRRKGLSATREVPDRLSNGDDNRVVLRVQNRYGFRVHCVIIDELPYQFQARNWERTLWLDQDSEGVEQYTLRPTERGVYEFGNINLYVQGPLRITKRRYTVRAEKSVKVYPSYVQMRRYQLMAVGSQFQQTGVKRMRKLGHSMEFEQIKEYVNGDDYRTINWKATARRGDLMVNNYTDERSQQIYCAINKGRVMKMPFEGMTLLDYAINAALVLTGVALQRQDKAGLITFAQDLDAFIPADKKPTQINHVIEALYKQETVFMEPDFERLFSVVRNRITHRSLVVLFTNFESMESLERELPTLKKLAHYHLLMVVFFENTELKQLIDAKAATIEDIYIKTIAEKYRHEKRLIARELQKHGIIAVLSTPQQLTVDSLNKYLEVKNKQSI